MFFSSADRSYTMIIYGFGVDNVLPFNMKT